MQAETITAAQIHADFYGAEERLYVEAVGLSKGSLVSNSSKAERLKKIGFGSAKPIKDDIVLAEKRKVAGNMLNCIEYFRTYYPQYKFITEAEVKTLCEKYGLLLGGAANYTGDMPEKNLQDIEKFKLRKEDWSEVRISYWDSPSGLSRYFTPQSSSADDNFGLYFAKPRQSGRNSRHEDLLEVYMMQKQVMSEQLGIPTSRMGVDPYKNKEEKKPETKMEQPAFKICAPKEDFNTRGFEIRDGYRLVWDPVVLQPVSKDGIEGYLIVTAWGDEASDSIVTNPISN